MNVLICGGRDYNDEQYLWEYLDKYTEENGVDLVIEGGATGVDRLANLWAIHHGVHVAQVRPRWDFFGKKAGHLRNAAMLRLNPMVVIAFPGGVGTANMIKQAKEKGVPVIEVPPRT